MRETLSVRVAPIVAALAVAVAVLSTSPGQAAAATTTGYRLPFLAGTRVYVSTTWGAESHVLPSGAKVNAYDFIRVTSYGATYGLPLVASAAGTVVGLKTNSSTQTCGSSVPDYANYVKIRLPDGTENWYWHLKMAAVTMGQTVAQGQIIGQAGNTGNACPTGTSGSHLHFQLNSNSAQYYFVEGGNVQLAKGTKLTSQNYAPVVLKVKLANSIYVALDWTNKSTDSPKFVIQRQDFVGSAWTSWKTLATVGSTTFHYDDWTVFASFNYRICTQTNLGTNCGPTVWSLGLGW
jgi:murein DD-endopeptidase MepM/ murein hydrolase activator NlpD